MIRNFLRYATCCRFRLVLLGGAQSRAAVVRGVERRLSEGHTSCASLREKQSESGRLLHANPTAEQRWLTFPRTAHESPSKPDARLA